MKNLFVDEELVVVDLRTALWELMVWGNRRDDSIDELRDASPNLTLNVENATVPTRQLWIWVVFGIALQLAVMAVPGVATYYWKWEKGGQPSRVVWIPMFPRRYRSSHHRRYDLWSCQRGNHRGATLLNQFKDTSCLAATIMYRGRAAFLIFCYLIQ